MNEEEIMMLIHFLEHLALYCVHKDNHLIALGLIQIKQKSGLYLAIKIPHISVLLINKETNDIIATILGI